jgi:nucleoside-diphosphate-sugar epimerase
VHIADVAALYALAIARAPAGSFMYVESGEEALGEVVRAIAARLGLGAAQSWPAEQAIALRGRNKAMYSLGSTAVCAANAQSSFSAGHPGIVQSRIGSPTNWYDAPACHSAS